MSEKIVWEYGDLIKHEKDQVYLLHFEDKISPNHTTQHYLGYSGNVAHRLSKHSRRPDAKLLQAAKRKGIKFALARLWDGDRSVERKLKNRKNAPKLCPICNGEIEYREWES